MQICVINSMFVTSKLVTHLCRARFRKHLILIPMEYEVNCVTLVCYHNNVRNFMVSS